MVSLWPSACALVSPWPSVYAMAGPVAIHESAATRGPVVTLGPAATHDPVVTRGPAAIRGSVVTRGRAATHGPKSGLLRSPWARSGRARLSPELPCQPAPRGQAQPPQGAWLGSEEQRTSWRDLSVGGDVVGREVLRTSHQQREYKRSLAACQAGIFNVLRTKARNHRRYHDAAGRIVRF